MAWLRLTKQTGCEVLVNTDQVSEFSEYNDGTTVWCQGSSTSFRESIDKIAAMIERAEWRERVLRCACAIMSNEHANGLTSEQVWARAARFAMMEPERPAGVN